MVNDYIEINVKNADGQIIGKLDVADADINLIYQLADIAEPDSVKSSYVRSFTLPGSKRNNKIFNGIFEQGYSVDRYNPNLKLFAQVLMNGNIFFEGYFQLQKINKIGKDVIDYEVAIYGSLSSFFDDLGDAALVNTIDLSEYDHPFNAETIIASWGKSSYLRSQKAGSSLNMSDGYIYRSGRKVGTRLGQGYVYPAYYSGQTDELFQVDTLVWQPSIFAYDILKKVFSKNGYKWKSQFLESEYFKRLIIPCVKDTLELSQDAFDNAGFKANVGILPPPSPPATGVGLTYPELYRMWSTTPLTTDLIKIKFLNAQSNPGLAYDANTSTFTCQRDGNYLLNSKLFLANVFEDIYPGGLQTWIYGPPITGVAYIMKEDGTTLASKSFEFKFAPIVKFVNSYTINAEVLVEYNGPLLKGEKTHVAVRFTMPPTPGRQSKTSNSLGNAVQTRIFFFVTGYNETDSSRFYGGLTTKTIASGGDISMNNLIPDMTSAEFVKGINKMFNLHWQREEGEDKTFIIEPRDEFFNSSSTIINWTKRVDEGEILSIQPLYDLTANKYVFKYKDDADFYNQEYIDDIKEVYGTQTITVENDFITDTYEQESMFSASPLVQFQGTDMMMTAFVTDNAGKMKRMTPKPRILFWGGMLNTNQPLRLLELKNTGNISYTPTPLNSIPAGGLNLYSYPYAGHLDNPTSPNHDLSFGTPKTFYFPMMKITGNTLYSEFWENTIKQNTDKNNHLLTCKIVLTATDMARFDLRNTIQINNVYYRINKLTYNPAENLAEAELYKVYDYMPATRVSLPASTGNPQTAESLGQIYNNWRDGLKWRTWGEDINAHWAGPYVWNQEMVDWGTYTLYDAPIPTWKKFAYYEVRQAEPNSWSQAIRPDGDYYPLQKWNPTWTKTANDYSIQTDTIVTGKWNYIDANARAVRVSGEWNNVASGTKNINIQGDYNTVPAGLENVVIIGSNILARESNVSYINGTVLRGNGTQVAIMKSPTDETISINSGIIHGGKNAALSFNKQMVRGMVIGGIDNTNSFGNLIRRA